MRLMRTARARATEPKPDAFLLNLFRDPQTHLRSAWSPIPRFPKRKPRTPQAGLSLFESRSIGASAWASPRVKRNGPSHRGEEAGARTINRTRLGGDCQKFYGSSGLAEGI